MISQYWKDAWYTIWKPVLRVNHFRYKSLSPTANGKVIKLNLGSGTTRFAGWVNIDGNILHKPDMWLDARQGLPFKNQTVDIVYASHFFEHLRLSELQLLLRECRRVLRDDGILRIAVPNLGSAIVAYQSGDTSWFSTFPAEFRSLGGRFFNEMLCGDQHRLMFDFTFLEEVLQDVGFRQITQVARGESLYLASDDEALVHERSAYGGKTPDPWLLVEAIQSSEQL
jgi:predicted SAM-dependent methyltransferase